MIGASHNENAEWWQRPRAWAIAAALGLAGQLTVHPAALGFSTYFGGSGYDDAYAVAVDGAGNV